MRDAFASFDATPSNRFVREVVDFHGAIPHVLNMVPEEISNVYAVLAKFICHLPIKSDSMYPYCSSVI
jgi:hypothetical protein